MIFYSFVHQRLLYRMQLQHDFARDLYRMQLQHDCARDRNYTKPERIDLNQLGLGIFFFLGAMVCSHSSGLPPQEAPGMIAKKHNISFSFLQLHHFTIMAVLRQQQVCADMLAASQSHSPHFTCCSDDKV